MLQFTLLMMITRAYKILASSLSRFIQKNPKKSKPLLFSSVALTIYLLFTINPSSSKDAYGIKKKPRTPPPPKTVYICLRWCLKGNLFKPWSCIGMFSHSIKEEKQRLMTKAWLQLSPCYESLWCSGVFVLEHCSCTSKHPSRYGIYILYPKVILHIQKYAFTCVNWFCIILCN